MDSEKVRDRWFAAITAAAVFYVLGPAIVQTITAPKSQRAIGSDNPPLSGLATQVTTLSTVLLLAVCVASIVLSVHDIPHTGLVRLSVLLLPWLYLVTRDEYAGIGIRPKTLLYPLICVAIWILRPRLNRLALLGYLIGGLAVLSILMGQFMPAQGIYKLALGSDISPDKKIFSSGVLVGPLSNGNTLGQIMAMGLPAIFVIQQRRWRAVLVIAALVAALWAASRSCLAATALLIVLALLLRWIPRGARPALAAVFIVPAVAITAWLPFSTTDPTKYSNRGYVWQVSRQAWSSDVWFGRGSNFYSTIATTSESLGGSVFHAHNQYLQDLVQGGYVLGLLMALVVAFEIGAALLLARRGFNFGAVYLVGFVAACWLEVSYVLVDRYFVLPVMVIPFACILFTSDHDRHAPSSAREVAQAAVHEPTPGELAGAAAARALRWVPDLSVFVSAPVSGGRVLVREPSVRRTPTKRTKTRAVRVAGRNSHVSERSVDRRDTHGGQ